MALTYRLHMLSIVLSATSLYDNLFITYTYCKKRYWLLLAEMINHVLIKKDIGYYWQKWINHVLINVSKNSIHIT